MPLLTPGYEAVISVREGWLTVAGRLFPVRDSAWPLHSCYSCLFMSIRREAHCLEEEAR
jgi:hypothetical protein